MARLLTSDMLGHGSDKFKCPDGHGHPLKGDVRCVRLVPARSGAQPALRVSFVREVGAAEPADLPADVPLTPPADLRRVETPTPAHSHPISKDISGAANEAAAPPETWGAAK